MDKKLERNKCELCGGTMVTRKATPDRPYRYELSGLDNVLLVDIEVRECRRCRAQVPVIPRIAELHNATLELSDAEPGLRVTVTLDASR